MLDLRQVKHLNVFSWEILNYTNIHIHDHGKEDEMISYLQSTVNAQCVNLRQTAAVTVLFVYGWRFCRYLLSLCAEVILELT